MNKLRGGDSITNRSEELLKRMKKKRLAVSAEAISKTQASAMDNNSFSPPVYPKSEAAQALLMEAVYESILFHVDANPAAAQAFVQAFNGPEEFTAGEEIITQGQALADATKLYVLEQGECAILVDETEVGQYAPGSSFGELALMYSQPRKATIKATTPCKCWSIERKVFQEMARFYKAQQGSKLMEVLRGVPSLSILNDNDRLALAESLEEETYAEGDYIVREGQPGDHFYIIESGRVNAIKQGEGVVASMGPGDFFGERALLNEEVRAASCVAYMGEAVVLSLDRDHFEMLIGTLDEYSETKAPQKVDASRAAMGTGMDGSGSVIPEGAAQLELSDLKMVGLLGEGAFGRVSLVKNKTDAEGEGQTYALKAMAKSMIVDNCLEEHTVNEKEVMEALNHSTILRLYATFQDDLRIYLLIELCQGGELFTYLRDRWKFTEKQSKFYAAAVTLGFEHMHNRGIIYRDLKPENLLLDSQGFLKIADFGLAKFVKKNELTYTLCGTPDYLAPEIILSKGHSKPCDIWALGILIYEMCVGEVPFYSEDPMEIYQLILRHSIKFPKRMKKANRGIIERLIDLVPTKRLGATRSGMDGIKKHKWFAAFNWDGLAARDASSVEIPIRPKVRHSEDISNFDQDAIGPEPEAEPCEWTAAGF
jgi:CRP-like cAMP-binding protein